MIGLLCFALAVLASPFKSTLGSSGSRTMIAGSLPSCIAGFQQSCGFSQSFGPRRSCVGTGPVFVAIALENALAGRASADPDRAACANMANEHGESALGRATHSRRTAQARVSSCAVECRQIHGQAAWAAKPRMVHLSA